ncbi:MAG TPA: serine/threonine-protein kinase [Nannocystis sp.]
MFASSPADPVPDEDDGARMIGRFKVLGLVGRGGFGEVYAAHDPELDRRVALKVVPPTEDRAAVARLHREAMTMARLSHPNVARVFDVGDVDGHLFIAMEFIRGDDLRTWLSGQPRDWRAVREVFLAAGQGLAAAHREGIVHRDFTPEIVIIGEDGRARVIDFGLAAPTISDLLPGHTAEDDETSDASRSDPGLGGTPAYMAPELHLGRPADARSDQYSFCVALFEALHGRRPLLGRTWQTLSPQVLRGGLESVAASRKFPPHLRRTVLRGLSAAPERRFADMDALLAELMRDPLRQSQRRYLFAGAGLTALAGAVALWLSPPDAEPSPAPPSQLRAPADTCARDPARCAARVDALQGQLQLARDLRDEGRGAQALQLLTALADTARTTLGAGHPLSAEAERERAALAAALARSTAKP